MVYIKSNKEIDGKNNKYSSIYKIQLNIIEYN